MSKPWGGVGAWALDAERAEEEERNQQAAAAVAIAGEPAHSFPSLKEASATKPKKKKPVAMSLSQFAATAAFPAHEVDLHRLPTAPRERGPDELDSSRGFRSYGVSSGGAPARRSYGGGFDDDQRRPPRDQDLDLPSRADEVDNWSSEKKSFAPAPARYSSLAAPGGGVGGGPSRADDVDNWTAGKKALPSKYPSFGTGYRDTPASSDPDRWARGAPPSNGDRERPRLVLAPPKAAAAEVGTPAEPARSRPSPFGAARPREEVLKEKGLDWRKLEAEPSRPTSSHSSRPSSAQSSRPGSPGLQASGAEGAAAPARTKVNPFGDAKPREVLLQERGKDWRKIDLKLEHGRVDRPETDEEKLLKEEINNLNQALTKETEGNPNDNSSQEFMEKLTSLREQIKERENQLELLICELDDKVRFSQRSTDIRPGSGAGRVTLSSDRPPQPGMFEESRSMEFTERPRSRGGMGDAWGKPVEERRRGGRESSYFGSRNMERPKSREGW